MRLIIQNYSKLANTQKKKTALKILEAGLRAAMPENSLKRFVKSKKIKIGKNVINLSKYDNIYLVAFGKAADSMAKTVNSIINIKRGFIVIPKGSKPVIKNKKFRVFRSGHPVPNQTSLLAAKTILKFLQKRKKKDYVIFLVSGGTSSLLALPDEISLSDKIQVTNQLLQSGATIQELNCVRKHLSKIKGGKLIENMQCDGASLVMSDVIDDDLSSIASGTTYYDNTTFSNAQKIIKKYNLQRKLPKKVLNRLRYGSLGKISETPKKPKIKHQIIASNHICIKAMSKKSKQLGKTVRTITLSGDVKYAASRLFSLLPKKENACVIFGGETTVHVMGKGKGGRNQELVLHILKKMKKTKQNFVAASLGTDGIDGNTKYAGAIIENIITTQNEINSYLKKNDSSSFFQKHRGLIKTGHTHTNLMDIGLILT